MRRGETDVAGGMPVFGRDFEDKGVVKESVDGVEDGAAVWDC
jgi:hypothetical protein